MRARTALLGTLGALTLLTGCTPFQIEPTLDRIVIVTRGSSSDQILVTGKISCTRSEPVDLFPTFTQGSLVARPGERSVPCLPGDPRRYTMTFDRVPKGFAEGEVRVSIDYCTNPAEEINGDCVTISRLAVMVELD